MPNDNDRILERLRGLPLQPETLESRFDPNNPHRSVANDEGKDMRRAKIDDEDLEAWNDASAAASRSDKFWEMNPVFFNALVCEVQAWRRMNPTHRFVSGPNKIVKAGETRIEQDVDLTWKG